MLFSVPFYLLNLVCSWYQCEFGAMPPFVYTSKKNSEMFRNTITGRSGFDESDTGDPIAYTTLGPVQGYAVNISNDREIYSFTGIPYGEPPERFRDPVPRKRWRGILQAKSPSTYCIQLSAATGAMLRGEENCLYLDVHTPRLPGPDNDGKPGLPVLVWIPAGANVYGRSKSYGPAYFLKEDIILVPINVRFGVFGFLSTGDEASPGNYGLKDQALAIQWVYENIAAFGGDPTKISIGGLSSGGYASHLMLFTKHPAKKHVAGIFSMSGTAFGNHGLDTVGRVKNASNLIAASAGCPTSDEGKSREMVECLRNMNPYFLAMVQMFPYKTMPPMIHMLGPTMEPDLPNAFISELPEDLYKAGRVPPIPIIFSRAEDETGFVLQKMRYGTLQLVRRNWFDWMPQSLQLGVRGMKTGGIPTENEKRSSLKKLMQFYFGKSTLPQLRLKRDMIGFADMIADSLYNGPMWKAIEYHHKVGPTYGYINKQKTFLISKPMALLDRLFPSYFGPFHATDFVLLFNNTSSMAPLSPGSDFEKASRNLVNMVANFCQYGKPLYRTPNGSLVDIWKPVGDMSRPLVLEVGLVHNISMIPDPVPATGRYRIWDEVKF